MTDKEIIKALECCAKGTTSDVCSDCPLRFSDICTEEENGVVKLALDLITRQQADNERLKKLLEEADVNYNKCAKRFYKEGVKEFAEKLKSSIYINTNLLVYQCKEVESVVDDMEKEMVGDKE